MTIERLEGKDKNIKEPNVRYLAILKPQTKTLNSEFFLVILAKCDKSRSRRTHGELIYAIFLFSFI